jgi:hypothetical protein
MVTSLFSTIRIDVPLGGGLKVYLFVRDRDALRWHPWWGSLYGYLSSVGANEEMDWKRTDEGASLVAFRELRHSERVALLQILRDAPPTEVNGHRTLNLAIQKLIATDEPVSVAFFKAMPD